jgi:hypothetical protein
MRWKKYIYIVQSCIDIIYTRTEDINAKATAAAAEQLPLNPNTNKPPEQTPR